MAVQYSTVMTSPTSGIYITIATLLMVYNANKKKLQRFTRLFYPLRVVSGEL